MPSARSGTSTTYLKLTVFLAGMSVMVAEMAAPRLIAPSLGAPQLVWTNLIGAILAAHTQGATVRGRLADRFPTERAYAWVLVLSGVLVAGVPLAARPVLDAAAHAVVAQQVATFLVTLGAVSLFFAPPVFLLGMISPWAIRLAGIGREDLGRVAGVLAALAALGSISGTFAASLLALPLLGTRRTLFMVAAILMATGAYRVLTDLRGRLLAVPLALFPLLLDPGQVRKDPGQVFEDESLYQYVQVRIDQAGTRQLFLNEGLGVQSVHRAEEVFTGEVWDYMSALVGLVAEPGRELRVLVLGLAAGTMAEQIEALYGEDRPLRIDGVEIDPAVVEAGRRYFALDRVESLRVHVADARTFLGSSSESYDVIVTDAIRGFYVPFQLATREFYTSALERLSPNGIFVLNVPMHPDAGELLDAFSATLQTVFPHVARFQVWGRSDSFCNFIYVAARTSPAPPAPGTVPNRLPAIVLSQMRRSWQALSAPGDAWIFTDDRAPVELLTDKLLLGYAID